MLVKGAADSENQRFNSEPKTLPTSFHGEGPELILPRVRHNPGFSPDGKLPEKGTNQFRFFFFCQCLKNSVEGEVNTDNSQTRTQSAAWRTCTLHVSEMCFDMNLSLGIECRKRLHDRQVGNPLRPKNLKGSPTLCKHVSSTPSCVGADPESRSGRSKSQETEMSLQ